MENQGFEEEQPRAKEPSDFLRESSIRDSRFSFRPDASVKDSYPDNSGSISDGHVYEDISPGSEDTSVRSNSFVSPDDAQENHPERNVSQKSERNDHRTPFDIVNYISREALARTSDPEEESSSFRRNLTLPFRRGTALDLGSSVRVTCRERNSCRDDDDPELAAGNHYQSGENPLDRHRAQSAIHQADCRPGRRRRKKDCKHCRNKAGVIDADVRENREMILKRNRENEEQYGSSGTIDASKSIGDHNFAIPSIYRGSGRTRGATIDEETSSPSPTVFAISEKIASGSPSATLKFIECERNDAVRTNLAHVAGINEDKALIVPTKNRVGMRVNSIYSQERWYAKEAPIFFTDVKEHSSFQRAYSLPVRTQTPSSQNRVNLRRSVRGEPPPHPARLDKHRHGWTLHLARPLESSGCTRSLVLLLIVILVLLGVGAIALYIVFEPEKLQIIQQYLRSSTVSNSSSNGAVPAGKFIPTVENDEQNETSFASSTPVVGVLLNGVPSFPESTPPVTETETEAVSLSTGNSTRYCDDCVTGEVCVALVDEEVPICRLGLDHEDPTGCAGFCLINKQKCHRLDVDAFRCVEVDHYCLDDEWTCSNTLCIPLEKHCDGHMNCYDHSDEYNCVCNLETHFQCGNETSCLPLEKRCDGKIDCWDAADEINCTLGRNLGWSCPMENEFTCSNGQCILKARFCDGLTDCVDGSDEPHGCQGRCNKHEFTCQNSRCITKGMKCNGIDDCGDGTDERHCKDRFS